MSRDEALKKLGIGKRQWALFLKIAADNASMRDHGWAYLGGMKDALWALASKDKAAYDVLEAEMPRFKKVAL